MLSGLCAKSRQARLEWMRAGCPSEGPLHSEKNRLRNAVCRKRIRYSVLLKLKDQGHRGLERENVCRALNRRRFKTPGRSKERCSKLLIDNEVVQDKSRQLDSRYGQTTSSQTG